jgi:hypothetical protein
MTRILLADELSIYLLVSLTHSLTNQELVNERLGHLRPLPAANTTIITITITTTTSAGFGFGLGANTCGAGHIGEDGVHAGVRVVHLQLVAQTLKHQ